MNRDDDEPPFLLDGARIVQFACLDPRGRRSTVVVSGVSLDPQTVTRLAVVQTLMDETLFVLHCNERWETVAAEPHAELAGAERSVANAYGAGVVEWRPYRQLTDEENREIASTREFLRELVTGDFNQ
jgi:hypothetical protein